ncbi:hypothetical protein KSP39_PZI020612 [Platanthera zijinensis]|uniref:Uncharacterized protein n=1 Tax=Platanthera zijinensis TaxID=2320716 RepID=A0AAP0B085_9ASPA
MSTRSGRRRLEHFSNITMRLTEVASGVVTKTDKWSETFETVHGVDTRNYIFYLRNSTGSETLDKARGSEAGLFESHHVHSRMYRPNVGITSLAQELMLVLAAKCFPIILGKEDTHINPYGKILQKEVNALDTVCARKNNFDEGHKQADDGVDSWTVDCVCGARDDDPKAHGHM